MSDRIPMVFLVVLYSAWPGAAVAVFRPEPVVLNPTDQPYSQFGYSAACGDTNGDGFDDVAIGAAHWTGDPNRSLEGRVYVYLGGTDGIEEAAAWVMDPTDRGGTVFGSALAMDDFNADGYQDLLIAARDMGLEAAFEGAVYLYLGSESGLEDEAVWMAHPADQQAARFGGSIASAGDVNADGYPDAIIGSGGLDIVTRDEGRVWVYHGGPAGLSQDAAWSADGPIETFGSRFGSAVSGAGDVNRDGFDDVIISAGGWDGEASSEGRVYLYLGGPGGLGQDPAWVADPTDQAGSGFGCSVSSAGDVNGDGYADVLVGASGWDGEQEDEGRLYLYQGSAEGLSVDPIWTADPTDLGGSRLGATVAGLGDVDGDGYDDVAAGATWWSGDIANEGLAMVYAGGVAGPAGAAAFSADPTDSETSLFGYAIAGGDLNGDGQTDLVVGANKYGELEEGRAYVYLAAENCHPECLDDDVCNGVESCEQGTCLPGTPLGCDDGNPCTDDSCQPDTGCLNQLAPDCHEGSGCGCNVSKSHRPVFSCISMVLVLAYLWGRRRPKPGGWLPAGDRRPIR